MAIPHFGPMGLLPAGVWPATLDEIVKRFCTTAIRKPFKEAIENISGFALKNGATRIIFGGSFITKSNDPSDLDILIVFSKNNQLITSSRNIDIDNITVDIVFCSEDQPFILSSYVTLFSKTRFDKDVGIVELSLQADNTALTEIVEYTDQATLDATRWHYFNRHIASPKIEQKILVTIHGIKSHAAWNADVTRVASAAGWVVCPFIYGYQGILDYFNPRKRARIVDDFRDFIFDIQEEFGSNISIIAHSFGTFVVGKYLYGFNIPPVKFKTIILTGSILHRGIDFATLEKNALRIINETSRRDTYVKMALMSARFVDPIVGDSGVKGFDSLSEILSQSECVIFNHNNVIRKDVVLQRWMPELELFARRKFPEPPLDEFVFSAQ